MNSPMKIIQKLLSKIFLPSFLCILLLRSPVFSETQNERWTPLRLSYPTFKSFSDKNLFTAASLPNRAYVYGLDIGLIYTKPRRMYGLQFSLISESEKLAGISLGLFGSGTTNGKGIQIGIGTNVEKKLTGLQLALIANNFDYDKIDRHAFESNVIGIQGALLANLSEDMSGIQVAAMNFSGKTSGIQVGIINSCDREITGIQIGLLNFAKSVHGIQVGLINHISGRSNFRTLPIINAGW